MLHLDQKAYADARGSSQLILAQAVRAPHTANELSNLLGTHAHNFPNGKDTVG